MKVKKQLSIIEQPSIYRNNSYFRYLLNRYKAYGNTASFLVRKKIHAVQFTTKPPCIYVSIDVIRILATQDIEYHAC